MRVSRIAAFIVFGTAVAFAIAHPHVIAFGKWTTARVLFETGASRDLKVRPLLMDGRMKEYTIGAPHDVTERLFVVQRAFRVNDSLPQEAGKPAQWSWQMGGWLSVDRSTGRVAQLNLPSFDPEVSEVSWFRDFAGYCGFSEDGAKAYMMVFQIGTRKPLLKKELAGAKCSSPQWERGPARVTFAAPDGNKTVFAVHGHTADLQPDEEEGP